MENTIKVIVRIVSTNEDIDVDLPTNATATDVIESLLEANVCPRNDHSGNPITYQLTPKGKGVVIGEDETLAEAKVQEGDLLLVTPVHVGGGPGMLWPTRTGKLVYFIPEEIEIANRKRVFVRISKKGLKDYLLQEGLITSSEMKKIEINKVMKVTVRENAIKEGLEIRNITDEEQLVTNEGYTEWVFDVVATKIGLSSIVLTIAIVKNVKGVGNKTKMVFLFEQEVRVVKSEKAAFHDFKEEYAEFEDVNSWTEETYNQLTEFIKNNDTGKALSVIAKHSQKNEKLQQSIIILKSQYNHGKNLSDLNLIEPMKWWLIQTRINYSILMLAKNFRENNTASFEEYGAISAMIGDVI